MRLQEKLDSGLGLVRFDLDVLIHRYMTPNDKKGTRDLQCLMFVEVKTHGGELKPAQQDTFSMLAQVLRNRRRNKHSNKKGRHAGSHVPLAKVFSRMLKRDVAIRMFGGHLLCLSGNDPTDSEWMTWDEKPIDTWLLIDVLRFDADPDRLTKTDWRRRYSDFSPAPSLFPMALSS